MQRGVSGWSLQVRKPGVMGSLVASAWPAPGGNAHKGSFEFEIAEQLRQRGPFVALLFTGRLPHAEANFNDPGAQRMEAAASALGGFGSPVDFGVDAKLQALKRTDPGGGDLQQGDGFDHHEDIADGVIRGRTMNEGQVLTQSFELSLGENAHTGEVIAIGNGDKKSGAQDIAEGMHNLCLSTGSQGCLATHRAGRRWARPPGAKGGTFGERRRENAGPGLAVEGIHPVGISYGNSCGAVFTF